MKTHFFTLYYVKQNFLTAPSAPMVRHFRAKTQQGGGGGGGGGVGVKGPVAAAPPCPEQQSLFVKKNERCHQCSLGDIERSHLCTRCLSNHTKPRPLTKPLARAPLPCTRQLLKCGGHPSKLGDLCLQDGVVGWGQPLCTSSHGLSLRHKDTHHPLEEGACCDTQNAWCGWWWAQPTRVHHLSALTPHLLRQLKGGHSQTTK